MKQDTERTQAPTGLVEHPLLLAFGAATVATVGSGLAVIALLL